jgi:hypothetical protein
VLALFWLIVMLYPDDSVATGAAVVVLAIFYGPYRHRWLTGSLFSGYIPDTPSC